MGTYDKGMRLSVKGLVLTGEQIVKLENGAFREEVFTLNDGVVASFKYNPLVDVGFSSTGTGQAIQNYAQAFVLPDSKIMEIAGGDTIKLRYDNGVCIDVAILLDNNFQHTVKENVARITKNGYYTIPNGLTSLTAVPYYKSGASTSQLVPLLSQDGNADGDIVAVFESKDGDHIVKLSDVTTEPIIGYVGGYAIAGDGTSNNIVLPSGNVPITGFGTVHRNAGKVDDILLSRKVPTGSPEAVDYSAEFSPTHYSYIQSHRRDWKSGWAGVGKVGYVVDLGDSVHMEVSAHGASLQIGEPDRVSTSALNDETPFVIDGGVMKEVMPDGTLQAIDIVTLDGTALINYIYANDMSQKLVIGGDLMQTEPFTVNGYSFGYGAGRLVDANLDAL